LIALSSYFIFVIFINFIFYPATKKKLKKAGNIYEISIKKKINIIEGKK